MIEKLLEGLTQKDVQLVAVSKTRSNAQILALYNKGQRVFGENRVQELVQKHETLPKDIKWHLIGHLQTNKVKQLARFIDLIHSVDSFKLLKEINKQANAQDRTINVLLQMHIAQEKEKYGLSSIELREIIEAVVKNEFPNVKICGLMGMATFTDDEAQVRKEFNTLNQLFTDLKTEASFDNAFQIRSMGMSGDYKIAIEAGSNMVRIGSLLFK